MMKFYTDIMFIDPVVVGLLMMAARFVDAFSDVIMGQIVDRSKPRKNGKFKPWLLRMCGPVAVAPIYFIIPISSLRTEIPIITVLLIRKIDTASRIPIIPSDI